MVHQYGDVLSYSSIFPGFDVGIAYGCCYCVRGTVRVAAGEKLNDTL